MDDGRIGKLENKNENEKKEKIKKEITINKL